MAKFGRPGKAAEIMAEARLPEEAKIAAPAADLVAEETEKDILFFSFTGRPSDRRFLTALADVQRCVLALGGAYVPLRPDAQRGIYEKEFIMVSFCVPVVVRKEQVGTLDRPALLKLLTGTDPVLCKVLADIEEGVYDGR